MDIHDRLSMCRRQTGLSQGALAAQIGVTRQAVSKWECGLSMPDMSNLIKLAEIFQVDIQYLTGITDLNTTDSISQSAAVRIQERIVEKVVERVIEKPVVRHVIRFRYIRNPIEYLLTGFICFLIGLIAGHII